MALAKTLSLFLLAIVPATVFGSEAPNTKERGPFLRLVDEYKDPVFTVDSPGADGNKYGFEGGSVVKVGNTYHMFTTEMSGEPRFVKTKLAYWTSLDRIHWTRVSTVFESTADMSGNDVRSSLWAPMPIYNRTSSRWELYYVGYRAEPEGSAYPPKSDPQDTNPYLLKVEPNDLSSRIFYNYSGTIWHAVSRTKGYSGIGGPYRDIGIIMKPGPDSQRWEGIQGTDSFFPYQVNGKWYGFYGSCHCESKSAAAWQVGLAAAPDLAGPWRRVPQGNPVLLDDRFVENPIVTQVEDGTYIAVFNGPQADAFEYATSRDGIHWNHGINLSLLSTPGPHWARRIRTPLGLISEGNNTFTLFYTAHAKANRGETFSGSFSAAVGFVTLKLDNASTE